MSSGLRILICIAAIMFESPVAGITSAQERTNLTGEQLIQRVEPSIVLVLVGDGQGRPGTGDHSRVRHCSWF